MGEVTGPISTLPGTVHGFPDDARCDYHPDVPTAVRIQGETDSFGCEMEDLCQSCWEKRLAYRRSDEGKEEARLARIGTCEWCGHDASDLRDARDYDEGMSGPVYRVCGGCIKRRDERIRDELDSYNDRYGNWD